MKISIFGLGYVGAVSAGCLARDGHEVIGVDPTPTKVALINEGKTPVIEPQVDDIIASAVREGRLRATNEAEEAIQHSDLSFICVGTPSQLNGSLDLKYVRHVCEEIGRMLWDKTSYHVVAVRSTMLPGSMRNVVIPTLEAGSGKTAGEELGVCVNPEFLREGSAIHDFYNPPKTVIGEIDQRSGDVLAQLYEDVKAPLIRTDLKTAEMVKYTDNVWHALKVSFANEIGNVCKQLGIDGHRIMEIFCQDTKLNLSPYYLKPGFAFGGSCLPKDLRALTYKARSLDLDLPVLNAIALSNERQLERGIRMILDKGHKRVGVLGFSFKAGTDDLRESPVVEVVERMLGKGFDIKIYDRNVSLAKLVGANREFLLNSIPHISSLLEDNIEDVIEHADTLILGNNDPEFVKFAHDIPQGKRCVDLVRIADDLPNESWYEGIAW